MNYIQLKDVSKYCGSTKAVENLNIEIKKGEFVIFLGPSGCGKSTTLRLIAGLEEVSSGQIEIDGTFLVCSKYAYTYIDIHIH